MSCTAHARSSCLRSPGTSRTSLTPSGARRPAVCPLGLTLSLFPALCRPAPCLPNRLIALLCSPPHRPAPPPPACPELRRHKRGFLKLATKVTFARLQDAAAAQRMFVDYLRENLDGAVR